MKSLVEGFEHSAESSKVMATSGNFQLKDETFVERFEHSAECSKVMATSGNFQLKDETFRRAI
jgi:hypothetical protein